MCYVHNIYNTSACTGLYAELCVMYITFTIHPHVQVYMQSYVLCTKHFRYIRMYRVIYIVMCYVHNISDASACTGLPTQDETVKTTSIMTIPSLNWAFCLEYGLLMVSEIIWKKIKMLYWQGNIFSGKIDSSWFQRLSIFLYFYLQFVIMLWELLTSDGHK